jgi:hypothetical protein
MSFLPFTAAGVYTLTVMIVFYNYVIDTNIVFHTLVPRVMRIFKTILCLWRHQMNSFGEVDLDEERCFSLSSVDSE